MYTIYTANRCQFCEMAKGLLRGAGLSFDTVNIDNNEEAKEFILNAGHRSVPQLYYGITHVASGYHEVESYVKSVTSRI